MTEALSPIVRCLNAGWTVGLAGVSDEHAGVWGMRAGVGRTGIWVRSLDRAGVHQALLARRFFATGVAGLRVDAATQGIPMGGRLPFVRDEIRIELDVRGDESWVGRRLLVQVRSAGEPLPRVLDSVEFDAPGEHERSFEFRTRPDPDSRWLVLRVTDPASPADPRAAGEFAAAGEAIAYTSPFFLGPAPSVTIRRRL